MAFTATGANRYDSKESVPSLGAGLVILDTDNFLGFLPEVVVHGLPHHVRSDAHHFGQYPPIDLGLFALSLHNSFAITTFLHRRRAEYTNWQTVKQ